MTIRQSVRFATWLLAILAAISAFTIAFPVAAHADDDTTVVISVVDEQQQPLSGVSVTIEGDGYTTSTESTGDDGKITVKLPRGVTYTMTADTSTLPSGQSSFKQNPITVKVTSSLTTRATFITGAAEGGTDTSSSSTSADDDSTSGSSGSTTSGDDSESSTEATGKGFELFMGRVTTGLIFGIILALAAIGVSLVYGTTGLSNFAQGEMTTLGGFASLWFIAGFGLDTLLGTFGSWLGLIFAGIIGAAFGWLQDAVLWRPMRHRHVGIIQVMVVSIGLSLFLRYVFAFIAGPGRLLPDQDLNAVTTIFGVNLTYWDVWGSLVSLVLIGLTFYVLGFTRMGKATRAVSDNKALAAASGIDVDRTIRLVWIGSGFLAAISGVLFSYYQTLSFQSGAQVLLLVFAAVTLGGLGTAVGGFIGSLILGVVIELSVYVIPTSMKMVTALLIMIIILLVRPQGLLGKKQRVG